ncbi:MAG: hypothetical protein ACK5BV_09300 [Bacteroidota bacterium]
MKQILSLLLISFLTVPVLFAQVKENAAREEKIQTLEIAFISRKLNLNPEEAQKFWPVYNEYKREVRQIAITQKAQPDRDVIDFEQKVIDVRKKYKDQFSGVIGQARMNQFFKAEHEFRGVLLNKVRNQSDRPRPQIKREFRQRN